MKKTTVFLVTILLIISSFQTQNISFASEFANIETSGATFVIDLSHSPYKTDYDNLIGNLTHAGNEVILCESSFDLPRDADALFLPDANTEYTPSEQMMIKEWFYSGDKLLFVGADSDYGGYFNPDYSNNLLHFLGAHIFVDDTSIEDTVENDGAVYRVAATNYGTGPFGSIVSENCDSGVIMHGPCSILGFDEASLTYVDLRNTTLANVEILLSYSINSSCIDSDASHSELDLYAYSGIMGDFPAVVYEEFDFTSAENSHLIIAGECIFSDYKEMYDLFTEGGYYILGTHSGFTFVNNIINYFVKSEYNVNERVYIKSDEDFLNYGFPGTGTDIDPYLIEDLHFDSTSSSEYYGIYIANTKKHFLIRNCIIEDLSIGIFLDSVTGSVDSTTISNCMIGIGIENSSSILMKNSYINYNNYGILIGYSHSCMIRYNMIEYNEIYGVSLDMDTYDCQVNDNSFSYNNINNESSQALDDGWNNKWDHNYWSDLDGEDFYSIDGTSNSRDNNPSNALDTSLTSSITTSESTTSTDTTVNISFPTVLSTFLSIVVLSVFSLLIKRKR